MAPRWQVSLALSWAAHADKHQLSPVHSGMIKTHTFTAAREWTCPVSHVDYPGGGVTGQRAVGERAGESVFHPAEEEGTRTRRRHHGYERDIYLNINHRCHMHDYSWIMKYSVPRDLCVLLIHYNIRKKSVGGFVYVASLHWCWRCLRHLFIFIWEIYEIYRGTYTLIFRVTFTIISIWFNAVFLYCSGTQ